MILAHPWQQYRQPNLGSQFHSSRDVSKELFYLRMLPFYKFSSFKTCTEFPKSIMEHPIHIERFIKMKVKRCWRLMIHKVEILELCKGAVLAMCSGSSSPLFYFKKFICVEITVKLSNRACQLQEDD